MAPFKLRSDDEVVVISGKDKGKTGRVLSVDTKRDRIYVEGVNIVKRHQRANPARPNAEVGVVEKEAPIHVSNVALADPKDGKATRVGVRRTDDGKPIRYAKRSGTEID